MGSGVFWKGRGENMTTTNATTATTSGTKISHRGRPAAVGMKRAKDDNTGLLLKHSIDDGRLYVTSADRQNYYLCATCDYNGRDPYVAPRDAALDIPLYMRTAATAPDADDREARDEKTTPATWPWTDAKV
jgi:hypothetical protein